MSVALVRVLCLSARRHARDGRTVRKERKVKHMMALQRFVNRSSGLLGKTADSSLESLGLASLCPTHYHRLPDWNYV